MGKGIVKLGEGNWAVKDGNLLAAKETNGRFKNAEFTVARGTRATYVGRDGLIKESNLQDTNLVQNGDFEELGSELVTNGSFDTDSGWTLGADWSIVDGEAVLTGSGSLSPLTSDAVFTSSKTYKLTYEISSYTNGSLQIVQNNQNIPSSVGIHTVYVTDVTSIGFKRNGGINGGVANLSIDNVSVKQVDPNDYWNLTIGSPTIEEGVAIFPNSTSSYFIQVNVVDLSVKNYKLTYEVVSTNGNNFRLAGGNSAFGTVTLDSATIGKKTAYLTSNGSQRSLQFNNNAFIGSFTNVSIQEVKTDTPRIDFTENTDGHLLLEPQSTNLVTYSEDFQNSYWNTVNRVTIETTSITSPNGSNNTYKLFANTVSNSHYLDNINYSGASSGQTYTYSVFVKSAGSDFIQLASSSGFPARYQNFNLSTGAKASGDISNATIEAYPNGWYRISVTETTNSTSRRFLIVPVLTDNSRNPVFVGNAQEDGVYIFGAQLEALSYPTSYIPTNGSTVTRDAETCTGAGEAVDFNSSEGVLYIETAALANSGTFRLISISDGTLNNEVTLYYRNNDDRITARLRSGSGSQVIFESFNLTATNFSKVAFRYKGGESNVFIDGVKQKASDYATTSMPVGLNSLQLSEGQPGNLPFYGKCKAIRVYKEALSDSELTTLTS